ncbi:MAG: hypothetical protein NC452_03985 [Eubacterium sp.]|nr:hypothetical protein [Eubacterium sp.]
MADYIERETLINIIKERNGRVPEWIGECISECPVTDAHSEKHGKWVFGEFNGIGTPVWCSECGERFDNVADTEWLSYPGHKYCGHCGAKMDEEDDD